MGDGHWTLLIAPPLWCTILTGSLGVILIILNSIEISMLQRRQKKKAYEKLLLSMSVADLLIGVLGIASGAVGVFSRRVSLLHLEIIGWYVWSIAILFGISILHWIGISIDRFFATPLRHRIRSTGRKVALLIGVCWVIPIILIRGPLRGKRDGVIRHMLECENGNWMEKVALFRE